MIIEQRLSNSVVLIACAYFRSSLSWDEVAQQLNQSLGHLDRLNCPVLRDFKNSEDPKLQSYAQRFDLSRSDKCKVS